MLPGDINGDGIVNTQDLALVSSGWLSAGPTGDDNGDGIVNSQDLALISSQWLATLPASSMSFGSSQSAAYDDRQPDGNPARRSKSSPAVASTVTTASASTLTSVVGPVLPPALAHSWSIRRAVLVASRIPLNRRC